jgi:hypothetical protein
VRTYDELVWKPALFHAGVIPEPAKDARGRRQYFSSRENGMHALRHYYASITLADGVNIKELAHYLGTVTPGSPCGCTPTCCLHRTSGRGRLSTRDCPGCSRWKLTEL